MVKIVVLWGQNLWCIVDNIVIEYISSPLHSLFERFMCEEIICLFGLEVATLHKKLLKFEEIILYVLVFLKESMLVGSFVHKEELLTQIIN